MSISHFLIPDSFKHYAASSVHSAVDVVSFLDDDDEDAKLDRMSTWDFPMLCGLGMFSPVGRDMALQGIRQAREMWLQYWMRRADVDDFWRAMRCADAVIGGAAAVHFALSRADQHRFPAPPILDIVCPGTGYSGLCDFIRDRLYGQHRALSDTDKLPESAFRFFPTLGVQFRHYMRTPQGLIHIICCTDGKSALYPIGSATATHLFSYISADAICLAYPSCFIEKHTLGDAMPPPKLEEPEDYLAPRSYVDWGFTFHDRVGTWIPTRRTENTCEDDGFCSAATRYFGDKFCVMVSLTGHRDNHIPHTRTSTIPRPDSPSQSTGGVSGPQWTTAWILGGKGCGSETCFVETKSGCGDILIVP